jgi:AraC-like DNA-binding protein
MIRRTLQEKFSNALLLQPSAIEVPSRQKEFLAQVMASIERHMADEEFGVETLASDVAMSRAQLHRKLKALTNQSPNELIRSFRLHRAADLIAQDAGLLQIRTASALFWISVRILGNAHDESDAFSLCHCNNRIHPGGDPA